jgi:hypothetical protein
VEFDVRYSNEQEKDLFWSLSLVRAKVQDLQLSSLQYPWLAF